MLIVAHTHHFSLRGVSKQKRPKFPSDSPRPVIMSGHIGGPLSQRASPAWWAPSGFAVIPTAAIDPPHRAASPAVPALMGPGPQFTN
jgi:hypothetical protein